MLAAVASSFWYENKTEEQAVAVYEAEHGPIGDGKVVMRVIISKPSERLAVGRSSKRRRYQCLV